MRVVSQLSLVFCSHQHSGLDGRVAVPLSRFLTQQRVSAISVTISGDRSTQVVDVHWPRLLITTNHRVYLHELYIGSISRRAFILPVLFLRLGGALVQRWNLVSGSRVTGSAIVAGSGRVTGQCVRPGFEF